MSSHPCPFVRAVVAGDELEVDRLNHADGHPEEPAVLETLRAWALAADAELEARSDRPGSARDE